MSVPLRPNMHLWPSQLASNGEVMDLIDAKGIKPGDRVTARTTEGRSVEGVYVGEAHLIPGMAAIRVTRFGPYTPRSTFRVTVHPMTVEKKA